MTENEIKAEGRKLWSALSSAVSAGKLIIDPVTREFLDRAFLTIDLEGEKLALKLDGDINTELTYHKHVDFWNWGILVGVFLSELGRLKVILNDGKAGETTMSGENTGET